MLGLAGGAGIEIRWHLHEEIIRLLRHSQKRRITGSRPSLVRMEVGRR